MSMVMFVKNAEKDTLEETFQEALKIEKNMISLKVNPGEESSKDKAKAKAKSLVTKYYEEKKDTYSMDMESLQRIVKKLSNEMIDMNKQNGEHFYNTNKCF
jgi:hypothetical protein